MQILKSNKNLTNGYFNKKTTIRTLQEKINHLKNSLLISVKTKPASLLSCMASIFKNLRATSKISIKKTYLMNVVAENLLEVFSAAAISG